MSFNRKALERAVIIFVASASALSLAGCGGGAGDDPTGQVVATVGSSEITKRDLIAEFQANNLQPSEDPKARAAMLDRIVQRRLLVEKATEDKLDKSPDYLASVERAREVTLVGLLTRRLVSLSPTLSDDDARAFVADNPQMFANRHLLLVNQVQTAAKGLNAKSLEKYSDLPQIMNALKVQKRQFQTRQTVVDTANLPKEMAVKIIAMAPGDVFIVSQDDSLVASAIVKSEAQPIPAAREIEAAKQVQQRMQGEQSVKVQLDALRQKTAVKYQPGYGPPAATPATK